MTAKTFNYCYSLLLEGYSIEKNKVTLCPYKQQVGKIKYQVYSEQAGKAFSQHYIEIDAAIDKFLELSND